MIPASTIQNTTFLYRNRIREIAYAAMLAVTTVSRAVSAEVMKLAPYHLRMSVFCRVFVKASSVGFSIAQVVLVVSAFGFRAVSSAHARGTSQSSAKAISTPAQIRLKSLTRVWTSGGVAWAPVPGRSSVVAAMSRSEEHTSELQSHSDLVCRLLLEKKKKKKTRQKKNTKKEKQYQA